MWQLHVLLTFESCHTGPNLEAATHSSLHLLDSLSDMVSNILYCSIFLRHKWWEICLLLFYHAEYSSLGNCCVQLLLHFRILYDLEEHKYWKSFPDWGSTKNFDIEGNYLIQEYHPLYHEFTCKPYLLVYSKSRKSGLRHHDRFCHACSLQFKGWKIRSADWCALPDSIIRRIFFDDAYLHCSFKSIRRHRAQRIPRCVNREGYQLQHTGGNAPLTHDHKVFHQLPIAWTICETLMEFNLQTEIDDLQKCTYLTIMIYTIPYMLISIRFQTYPSSYLVQRFYLI